MHIRSAAVLGTGTMGAQLAAHLANAGVPSLLLDLEREAFLSLVAEPKTLDRIRHTLTTGKPLRN